MVKGSPRREFSSSWFVEDLGILGILWGKFWFHSFGSLGQGSRESKLLDVGVVLPEYSVESCCISLLGIDSGSEFGVVLLYGMEISQEISLFEYSGIVMSWNWGSPYPDCSGSPIDQGVCLGQPGMS